MHAIVDQEFAPAIIAAEQTAHAIRARGRRQVAFVGQPPSEPLITYGWKVVAAILQDAVIGWIDAAVERHLQSAPAVVIGGLVVRDDMRGKRIGQQLCHAVELWAVQIGVAAVRVRSRLKRADAHRFYLRDGYIQVKISAVFEKHVFRQA